MMRAPTDKQTDDDRIVSETELIETYLAPLTGGDPGTFGLRDDAALICPEPGMDLVVTSDPIIAGVHFFANGDPADIAWRALAVNASDLAAKGADPRAYMLNLAFPEIPQRAWMQAFADGLRVAQESFGCHLIGGDTDLTPGPLSIGVTIIGAVPQGRFVHRQGALAGDHVFVTGTIGDAALGLLVERDQAVFPGLPAQDREFLSSRYLRPSPRLALGTPLRAHASAALDVSDGLLKDLSRLAGPLGISINLGRVPLSTAARSALALAPAFTRSILTGGDDYELLVAVSPSSAAAFRQDAESVGVAVTDIGILEPNRPLEVVDQGGLPLALHDLGYDHFSR